MRHACCPSLIALLIAAVPAVAQTFPTTGPARSAVNLVCIGDSITECKSIPDRDRNGAPAVLARTLGDTLGPGTTVYLLNAGVSGSTTSDWCNKKGLLARAEPRIAKLVADHPAGRLVFSVMLGTNDSANKGPAGAPASAERYHARLQMIVDQLVSAYPDCLIFLHHPTWYSKNTHNNSDYEGDAAHDRLLSYAPEIDALVDADRAAPRRHLFLGDTRGYDHFAQACEAELTPQQGKSGTYYLHPNLKGTAVLGRLWAEPIGVELKSRSK